MGRKKDINIHQVTFLRELLIEANMRPCDLARAVGWSLPRFSLHYTGHSTLSVSQLREVCRKTNIPAAKIMQLIAEHLI